MSFDIKKVSFAYWYGENEPHRCGYCKSVNGNMSVGMRTETLTVEDYQNLIDRGWRRSGKYCYKPTMSETCCPQYTIKCEALNFIPSKSHKKVIKKFNKYLQDGVLNFKDVPSETNDRDGHEIFTQGDCPEMDFDKITSKCDVVIKRIEDLGTGEPHGSETLHQNIMKKDTNENNYTCDLPRKPDHPKKEKQTVFKKGLGADLNKPPCKKAKLLRQERKKEKLLKSNQTLDENRHMDCQKTLEQFLNEYSDKSKLKLRLELVPTSRPDRRWEKSRKVEYELYEKYQRIVHNDPPDKNSMESFENFLVKSPLKPAEFNRGVDGPGFGSFHQQYWIEDKLVAVGVIDILPKCVSSVYFFYDPDYRNLTLGTYGSLREVELTRRLNQSVPELKEYYLGFYIHSCPKMRYKGKLSPSYLLCPETYSWENIEKSVEKLDQNKYSRLNDELDAMDKDLPSDKEIGEIKIVDNFNLMYFKNYEGSFSRSEIKKIGEMIGRKCASRIVFFLN